MPDWDRAHREVRRKGVTLQLLWVEYHGRGPPAHRAVPTNRGSCDPVDATEIPDLA